MHSFLFLAFSRADDLSHSVCRLFIINPQHVEEGLGTSGALDGRYHVPCCIVELALSLLTSHCCYFLCHIVREIVRFAASHCCVT